MIIRELFNRGQTKGDIGLEIEVEGFNLPVWQSNTWKIDRDGSLRGESYEYVFKRPLYLEKVKDALDELSEQYKNRKSVHKESFRAGVHVHINCQELTITQIFNYITLYLIFENLFIKWCGPSRCGNLFCLSASDAEYLLDALRTTIMRMSRDKDPSHFVGVVYNEDMIRYSSMNMAALGKYGSLEFRAMRSTPDFSLIYSWASALLKLRTAAVKFDSPQQIMHEFSLNGVDCFMNSVLGGEFVHMFSATSDSYNRDIVSGVRNAQEIAFACDWEVVKEFDLNPVKVTCTGVRARALKANFDPGLLAEAAINFNFEQNQLRKKRVR